MIYLTGGINERIVAACRPDLGLLLQPAKGNRPVAGIPFGVDNDCFSTLRAFDEAKWLDFLERLTTFTPWCLFAVAPDVVGDAIGTLARSRPYLSEIAARGYGAAFVTQDGCHTGIVPWDEFACLFVGGTTVWKFSQPSVELIREAKRRGKWVHVGRVNSLRRMMTAHSVGADSADGTHLVFKPDRYLPQVLGWLDQTNAQLAMAV